MIKHMLYFYALGVWIIIMIFAILNGILREYIISIKFGEYFGFSKLSGKVSSSLGPIVFGAILTTYDIIGKTAYGWALISVGVIMVIGLLIISFVKSTSGLR